MKINKQSISDFFKKFYLIIAGVILIIINLTGYSDAFVLLLAFAGFGYFMYKKYMEIKK